MCQKYLFLNFFTFGKNSIKDRSKTKLLRYIKYSNRFLFEYVIHRALIYKCFEKIYYSATFKNNETLKKIEIN